MPTQPEDTKALIAILHNIARGSDTAIQNFYRSHYNAYIKFGHTITSDRHAIEDAIQNLLIWFVEHERKALKLQRPDVYFFRALRNNLIRENLKSKEHLQDKIQASLSSMLVTQSAEKKWVEDEEQQEIMQKLQQEISNLPDYLQQTLYLRYFSDMEYKDIGEILQIKPNVVRIYIHHAIERLRLSLKDLKMWWIVMVIGWGVL
ncbi:MAG TPA: sigma-70 family RNA polymerase sigma factor [Membranihabitans sp.]|nr:sigma-70 family RNA polymerase sigma factor [Membranihabitans sp.]